MPAANPSNSDKYWLDGTPTEPMQKPGADTSTDKHWFDGTPQEGLFPPAGEVLEIFFLQ